MGNQSTTEIIDNSEFEKAYGEYDNYETDEIIELEKQLGKYLGFIKIEHSKPIYNKKCRLGSGDVSAVWHNISYTVGVPFGNYFHVIKKFDHPNNDYCELIKVYHEMLDIIENKIIPNLGNCLNIK
jgi:hypothetical protein